MRVPLHLVERRREELRGLIRRDGFLPVAEICRRLRVSEATARRDLSAIASDGRITRTYGGALADYNSSFAPPRERATRARSAKSRIAARAAALAPAAGVLFLDAGTTVHAVAREMLHRRSDFTGLSVVTNSLPVATMLGGASGLELHVLGGTFLHRQAILLGPDAIEALGRWRFDVSFLGGEAFGAQGVFNSHPEIAAFQQAVLRHTRRPCFCLDASKLGRSAPTRVADWAQAGTLVTDAPAARLAAAGVPLAPERLALAR
ncbi:MAG TPA: DeoR/GlpR family DNA-binding transcription regulator [Opitutaceae bacterium]|nr:DeoR/GlpR family DNA-binding transcription regulator [Opitutaceae bacterium]